MLKRNLFLTILLTLLFIFPQSAAAQASANNIAEESAYLDSIMRFIHKEYQPGVTDDLLIDGSLNGMFNSLDIYTTLYSPSEAEAFLSELDGNYYGVGLIISKIGSFITVNKVLPDSPAAKAGILAGDRILSVDGTNIFDFDLAQAAELLRGKEGTTATLISFRPQHDIMTIKTERAQINTSPFEYEMKNGIAYIRMSSFTVNAGEYFEEILVDVDKHDITKIILDLRDNPGGELSAAVSIAQKLVPKGLVTSLDFKSPEKEDTRFYSTLEKTKYQLAVLVNGSSASASEILAGAIQDTKAGALIGTQTYGKSKVQSLLPILTPEAFEKYKNMLQVEIVNAFDLINEYNIEPADEEIIGWLKITTGEYFTPNGRSIDRVGLAPDFAVQNYQSVNGIDIRSIDKFMQTVKSGLYDESPDVESAEAILMLLGYDIDRPDLILDEKTFEAIKSFQAEHSLYPYGVLDYITQQTLSRELDRSILEIDTQYVKALEILSISE